MRSAERFFHRFEECFTQRVPGQMKQRDASIRIGLLFIKRQKEPAHQGGSISYTFVLDNFEFFCGRFIGESGYHYTWLGDEPDELQLAELKLTL